jgi:hypothetical protein
MDYTDGDFRTMTDTDIKPGQSRMQGGAGAKINLDKFLPSTWGVAVPLGGNLSASLSRPQQRPRSDIFMRDEGGEFDKLNDMYKDAFNLFTGTDLAQSPTTDAEHFETRTVNRKVYTGYNKNRHSKNPFTRLTFDRVSVDYSLNQNVTITGRGPMSERDESYLDIDTTNTHSGYLKYDLSPRDPPSWTQWEPLSASESEFIPSRLKMYRFSLLPSSINFDLAGVEYVRQYSEDARFNRHPFINTKRSFNLDHGFRFGYEPISPLLDLDYNVTLNRSLEEDVEEVEGWSEWRSFVREDVLRRHRKFGDYSLLHGESSRNQGATLRLDPQLFDWLTHSATYSSKYTHQIVNGPAREVDIDFLNTTVNSKFNFTSSLKFGQLFGVLADRTTEKGKEGESVFSTIDNVLDKIRFQSVEFSYHASSDLKNFYLGESVLDRQLSHKSWDLFTYQLGLKDRVKNGHFLTGNMDDEDAFGGMRNRIGIDSSDHYIRDRRTAQQDYSVSTSFSIPQPVDISFNPISLQWAREYSVEPDTNRWDSVITFPDLSLSANTSTLGRLPGIQNLVQNATLSSRYNYKKSVTKNSTKEEDDISNTHDFGPLIRVQGRLKRWPVHFEYSHSFTREDLLSVKVSRTVTNSDQLSLNYEIKRAGTTRELKLLRWNIPIKGKMDLSLKGNHTTSQEYQKKEREEKISRSDEPLIESRTWSLVPELSYVFTDNITGRARYTFEQHIENKITTTQNLFEIIVDIRF